MSASGWRGIREASSTVVLEGRGKESINETLNVTIADSDKKFNTPIEAEFERMFTKEIQEEERTNVS